MTPNEFYEKLKRIPVEAPDELIHKVVRLGIVI